VSHGNRQIDTGIESRVNPSVFPRKRVLIYQIVFCKETKGTAEWRA